MPLIVDLPTGAYVRSDRGRAMVGVKPRSEAVGFVAAAARGGARLDAAASGGPVPQSRARAAEGADPGAVRDDAGRLPVAGAVGGVAGGYVVAGFNGHGIMHAPAVAEAVAELIASGRSETIDLGPLRPDRFLAGDGAPVAADLL
jgi:sarcosine oxidase subunit beta